MISSLGPCLPLVSRVSDPLVAMVAFDLAGAAPGTLQWSPEVEFDPVVMFWGHWREGCGLQRHHARLGRELHRGLCTVVLGFGIRSHPAFRS